MPMSDEGNGPLIAIVGDDEAARAAVDSLLVSVGMGYLIPPTIF